MSAARCVFPDCRGEVNAREMCGRHYRRVTRGAEAPPVEANDAGTSSTSWQAQAVCRSVDPELFFPVSERYTEPAVAAARRVCAVCPVRKQCLEWALTALTAGIAGGLTTDERREIRDARKAAAAGQLEPAGGAR
jgi:hypothetical protein